MKIDYHIHSMFSADSSLGFTELIEKAGLNNYLEIAFTDHFDLLPSEIAVYGVPSYHNYSCRISDLKRKHPDLSILKGVELGEYHLCHDIVDSILNSSEPPDLKIASIHVLPDGTNISNPLDKKVTSQMIEMYYKENLALVEHGGFDILGHLGIYKRYLNGNPDESKEIGVIKAIFQTIIDQGIALEVNLSGLRNKLNDLIPSVEHLKLYRELGGELLTIGSDSHQIDHFDSNYEKALMLLTKCGFSSIARKISSGWEKIRY